MKAEFCPVSGKVKFASSKLAAAIDLRDVRKTSKHRKSGMATYRCTACNGFHIGRTRELKMARKAQRPKDFQPATQGE